MHSPAHKHCLDMVQTPFHEGSQSCLPSWGIWSWPWSPGAHICLCLPDSHTSPSLWGLSAAFIFLRTFCGAESSCRAASVSRGTELWRADPPLVLYLHSSCKEAGPHRKWVCQELGFVHPLGFLGLFPHGRHTLDSPQQTVPHAGGSMHFNRLLSAAEMVFN